MNTKRRHWQTLSVAALLVAAGLMSPARPAAAATFGTRCQDTFENDWQKPLPYAWDRCGGFNDTLDDTDTKLFYFNLKTNGLGFTTNDGVVGNGGVDTVDLFYVSTHGSVTNTDARLVFWNQDKRALSSGWRFGDNARGARIFSQYACETLAQDSFNFERWKKAFRGGLLLATGSHDKVYDGWTTNETGADYAAYLQAGKSVKWAWFDGNGDWWAAQDVAVEASSTGSVSECLSRLNGITWQNMFTFSRLRDNNMNRLCAAWIEDN